MRVFALLSLSSVFFFFFFNDTATTEIYTLSLHDALPISFDTGNSAGRTAARGKRLEVLTHQHSILALELRGSIARGRAPVLCPEADDSTRISFLSSWGLQNKNRPRMDGQFQGWSRASNVERRTRLPPSLRVWASAASSRLITSVTPSTASNSGPSGTSHTAEQKA